MIREDSSLNGVTIYQNGLGIDDKLRSKNGNTVRYFITDHLGSTVALTDASGKITSSTTYDSFGNAIPKQAAGSAASGIGSAASSTGSAASSTGKAAPNIATSYRYTGREYDADTGLYYYRSRWYDPEIGRFISEDPIGFAGGDINLYGYVGNNPLSFTDPSGNYACGSQKHKRQKKGGKVRKDLPKSIRRFIKRRQGQIDRCVNFVFGQTSDGKPSKVATRMPRQTLKNAPTLNLKLTEAQLKKEMEEEDEKAGVVGLPEYKKGTDGTVKIAKDWYFGTGGKPKLPVGEINRIFIHEWGNILSERYGDDWYTFGDPKGIGSSFKDIDTGARLERCVFGNVTF